VLLKIVGNQQLVVRVSDLETVGGCSDYLGVGRPL
jgi:hypothetical protein